MDGFVSKKSLFEEFETVDKYFYCGAGDRG